LPRADRADKLSSGNQDALLIAVEICGQHVSDSIRFIEF